MNTPTLRSLDKSQACHADGHAKSTHTDFSWRIEPTAAELIAEQKRAYNLSYYNRLKLKAAAEKVNKNTLFISPTPQQDADKSRAIQGSSNRYRTAA